MENNSERGRKRKLPIRRHLKSNLCVMGETSVVENIEWNMGDGIRRSEREELEHGYDESDEGDDEDLENIDVEGDDVQGESDIVAAEACLDLEEEFGTIAREKEESDADSGNEIYDEDEILNFSASSDDEIDDDGIRPIVHTSRVGHDDLIALGRSYNSATEFRHNLLKYSLRTQYDIKMYISSAKRIGAICSAKDCPWRVYCSYDKGRNKLLVKVYINEHICDKSGYSSMLKTSTIAELFEEDLRVKPKMTSTEMVNEIKNLYNLNVSVDQCKKAKKLVFQKRKTIHGQQFLRLWDYQKELITSNPGSTVDIETIPGPVQGQQRFFRIYICFESLKTSWKKTCRPIIGIDGAFLKWDIKGELLAAVGRDGDNRIFPIAWAIVEVENTDNWEWFIQHLKVDLQLQEGDNITIISDKQKGLVNAVHSELPHAEHRMCARHILQNWKRANKDPELEGIFWRIARSYTTGELYENLEVLKKYNIGAYGSLQCARPTTWSRAFFKVGSCCNDVLNNLSESFNKTIRNERKKPMVDMLEGIRRQVMERNAKRLIFTSNFKRKFTKKTHAAIEKGRIESKRCIRYLSTGDECEVDDHGTSYCVNLGLRTCGCVKWQLNGIPCNHAISVILARKLDLDSFVSEYYTTHRWQQTYSRGIRPVQGMKLWPKLNRLPIMPTLAKKRRGRPNEHNRKKQPHESASKKNRLTGHSRVMTCSNCKQEGHNRLTCSNEARVEEKRSRGRLRFRRKKVHMKLDKHRYKRLRGELFKMSKEKEKQKCLEEI